MIYILNWFRRPKPHWRRSYVPTRPTKLSRATAAKVLAIACAKVTVK